MSIRIPFSRRNEPRTEPVLYQYDELPNDFRIQVAHIARRCLGTGKPSAFYDAWREINEYILEEHGLPTLGDLAVDVFGNRDYRAECLRYFGVPETKKALDLIEAIFHNIDSYRRYWSMEDAYEADAEISADEAIDRLNHRFRQHGLGYEFVEGQIVKVNSTFMHQEAVQPAVTLLHHPGFEAAAEEFARAHKDYREGDYRGAIVNAENAVESVMKIICDQRKWDHAPNATAGNLIDILFKQGLIPDHFDDQKQGFRSMVTGLSVVRNKSTAAHGTGATPTPVPAHQAAFALHLAGANIVFLVESHKAMR